MRYTKANPIPKEDIRYIIKQYKNNFKDLEYIGSGSQGYVYRYKNYAIKDYSDSGCHDGVILEQLQDNSVFLKLYFYTEYFMVTEFLDITNSYSYYEKNIEVNFTALDLYNYCFNKGFIIRDVHDENVIITSNDELKIIDVGAFGYARNKKLEEIIFSEGGDFSELCNIISHVKRPPIAI